MRVANADGRSVVTVAPGDIVAIFAPADARIVAVLESSDLGVFTDELNGLVIDRPIQAVFGEPAVKIHYPAGVIDAKDAGIFPLKGTTALLKMLLARGIRLRGMTGLREKRQMTSPQTRWDGLPREYWAGRAGWYIV